MEWDDDSAHYREPDAPLMKGGVVQTHKHNFPHWTDFRGPVNVGGLFDAYRFVPICGGDGKQLTSTESSDGLLWQALPVIIVGGPGKSATLHIPAEMKHKFVARVDFVLYRCRFLHRDPLTGLPVEGANGNKAAYC